MQEWERITFDPQRMGGRPCIRGLRVTVGTIVGLVASGHSAEEIVTAYPYLEAEDIRSALPAGQVVSNADEARKAARTKDGPL